MTVTYEKGIEVIEIIKAIFLWFAEFMMLGGFFTFVIFAFGMTGIVLFYKKISDLKRRDTQASFFWEEVYRLLLNGHIHEALIFCSSSDASLAKILKMGLKKINQNKAYLDHAIHIAILEEKKKIKSNLFYFPFLFVMLILLGLLGMGYMLRKSFLTDAKIITSVNEMQKSKLFYMALSSSMTSLILALFFAILILVAYGLLRLKVDKIVKDLEEFSEKFIHFVIFDHLESENVKE